MTKERMSMTIDASTTLRTLIIKGKAVGLHIKCAGEEIKLQLISVAERTSWSTECERCAGIDGVEVLGVDPMGVSSDPHEGNSTMQVTLVERVTSVRVWVWAGAW